MQRAGALYVALGLVQSRSWEVGSVPGWWGGEEYDMGEVGRAMYITQDFLNHGKDIEVCTKDKEAIDRF